MFWPGVLNPKYPAGYGVRSRKPGALAAGLTDGLFGWSLLVSLVIAFNATVRVNPLADRSRGAATPWRTNTTLIDIGGVDSSSL